MDLLVTFRYTAATTQVSATIHPRNRKSTTRTTTPSTAKPNSPQGKFFVLLLRLAFFNLFGNRRARRSSINDNNNNERKAPPVRPSISSNNVADTRNYMSDDQSLILRVSDERKGFVKRTKSFWKFGKNASDNEVLEGMALWKHRDLVDVDEKNNRTIDRRGVNGLEKNRKPSRDRSDDSDKTLNADSNNNKKKMSEGRSFRKSFNDKKLSLPRRASKAGKNDFENRFQKRKVEDEFYDHEDGLIMRTVNRKNILQQYTNDSSGPESDSETEITSDDPYDCIVVDDQAQMKKNGEQQFPNVAAIGKKLERLSKSSKYSPDKQKKNINNNHINNNSTLERNDAIKLKNEKNKGESRNGALENGDIINYRDEHHTFKTFGVEIQNNENGEKEINENDRYYTQNYNKRNVESNSQEKRRYYRENNELDNLAHERRMRSSYESINSDTDQREIRTTPKRTNSESESREKMRYYAERNRDTSADDEFSDAVENRKFLPRTKLAKANSNGSNANQEVGLMNYGESLKRRLTEAEQGAKYDERSPRTGNTYGPWYDLWGLDASVRK